MTFKFSLHLSLRHARGRIMPLSARVQRELPFLKFILDNSNERQTKEFLKQILSNEQYSVLQEVVENLLADRIPLSPLQKKKVEELKNKYKRALIRLQKATLADNQLPRLLELLQIVIRSALNHFSEDGAPPKKKRQTSKKSRPSPTGGMVESERSLPLDHE